MPGAAQLTTRIVGLDDELGRLRAINAQIDRACRRAIGQATRGATAKIKKGMAKETGAAGKAVKNRVTARVMRDNGLVWIGLDPFLPTHLAGNVAQTSTGVTAGNRSFVGAFHAAIFTPEKKVWIRLHSRHYDADLYPYKPNHSGDIDDSLRSRFPVVLGRVKVDTAAVRDMINHEADQARELLADLVAQELGYAIGKDSP